MTQGTHHIWPSSRRGSDDDVNRYPYECRWGEDYHARHGAWHVLFANLTPPEAAEAIRAHMKNNGDIEEKFFNASFVVKEGMFDFRWKEWVEVTRDNKSDLKKRKKRKDYWLLLFSDMNAVNAIEWIEREFIRKKWMLKESSK